MDIDKKDKRKNIGTRTRILWHLFKPQANWHSKTKIWCIFTSFIVSWDSQGWKGWKGWMGWMEWMECLSTEWRGGRVEGWKGWKKFDGVAGVEKGWSRGGRPPPT